MNEKREDGHIAYECYKGCGGCRFCHGGLFACTRCGGFEGTMPSQCPGVKLTKAQEDEIYAGRLDFRDGKWITAPSGSAASHYDGRPGLPKDQQAIGDAASALANAIERITFDPKRPGRCSCGGELVEPADHHTDACELVKNGHLKPRAQSKAGDLVPWANKEKM